MIIIITIRIRIIPTRDMSETNTLVYPGAVAVARRLGLIRNEGNQSKREVAIPFWRRRLEGQNRGWRQDVARITEIKGGRAIRSSECLMRTYQV